MNLIDRYNCYINEKMNDLKNAGKTEFDNYDLCKIFEYYTCIQLMNEYKQDFYEYNDIDPDFKEKYNMSKNDTGIDVCNMIDTIVQCKLRKNSLTWTDMSTFFASNINYCNVENKLIIQWPKLILSRNTTSQLSGHLKNKSQLFLDKQYDIDEMVKYCNNIEIKNTEIKAETITLRDYQLECIDLINHSKNLVICLPTGTGKNLIIIKSLLPNKKYLILVPRIVLLEQIKTEILKHSNFKNKDIQLIGDSNTVYNENKKITVCVYNSIKVITNFKVFHKIYVDEAHHIHQPKIYQDSDLKNDIHTKYIKKISELSKYNNNVYLSATIDKIDNFEFYTKDIREMIEKKYLCDYTINIPVFSDDPSNKNICEYLINNYRNIIIYCHSKKEGKLINSLMNSIQKNSAKYIDCDTKYKERTKILNDYKNGILPFLINVRILVEGFDAAITRGVCLMHMPSSKTAIIQIIGRALRLHPLKTVANIILPYSVNGDEKNITKFVKIISDNDSRIKKSYKRHKNGGYIEIDKIKNTSITQENIEDVEYKYDIIYNSLTPLYYYTSMWYIRLNDLKNHIDIHGKLPSATDKDSRVKSLRDWCTRINFLFKKREEIMADENIYNEWIKFTTTQPYDKYFKTDVQKWNKNYDKVIEYIDINKKLPAKINNYRLNRWLVTQMHSYKNKTSLMKNSEIILKKWENFIYDEKYTSYFKSLHYIKTWKIQLNEIINQIDTYYCLPEDKKIYMYRWVTTQKVNKFIKYPELKPIFEKFINNEKYAIHFYNNIEQWKYNLRETEKYFIINKKLPPYKSILYNWIQQQKNNIKNGNENYINKYPELKNLWNDFMITLDKYNIPHKY